MLFRVFYSVMFSIVFIATTGLPALAIRCSDVVSRYTDIRYSDALVYFTAYKGRTFAMAKSGATGKTTLPDAYFAFNANITDEHRTTGTDVASLKKLVKLGKYGAAKPVSVDSKETEIFLLRRYGKTLGSGTYIDVWKDYGGEQTFASITGGPIAYSNFASVYSGQEPQGVVMAGNGAWSAIQNGDKFSQIVEFPEELDCAVQPVPIDSIQPPSEPPTTPPDPQALQGRICGQDLNNNGFVGEQGETANCIQTPQGEFCPVGSAACVETFESVVCPPGSALEPTRDMCQADATANKCPTGYTWESTIDRCIKTPPCTEGGMYNTTTDRCEKLVINECPTGYTYDAARDICAMTVDCGVGGSLNTTRDRCERPPTWDCATGFAYNANIAKCEAPPYCPTGTTYNTTRNRCESVITNNCPTGYSYDAGLDKCVSSAGCTAPSTLNPSTDRCEMPIGKTCPVGYSYDAANDKCFQMPICISGGTYSSSNDICTTPITGGNCPSGYTYDSVLKTCTESPVCVGSSYNITRNRCEIGITLTCPTGYTVSGTTCQAAPVCGAGLTYNNATNRCEKSVGACPTGYSYDAGLDKCVSSAGCTAPSTLNPLTDRCEMPASTGCPSGTLFNATSSKCEVSPACPSPGSYNTAYNVCTTPLVQESCTAGYTYSTTYATCVGNPTCTSGTYNDANKRCETLPNSACPSGFTYNSTKHRCDAPVVCPVGSTYNSTLKRCVMNVPVGCPSGYTLNTGTSRCEKTPDCPAGTSYSPVTNRCEGLPGCTVGTYNSTSNNCVSNGSYAATITYKCPSGGSLNGMICNTNYSYTASLIPEIKYDVPFYYQTYWYTTDFQECGTSDIALTMERWYPLNYYFANCGIYGYASATPFPGSKASLGVYVSPTPLASGSVPVYEIEKWATNWDNSAMSFDGCDPNVIGSRTRNATQYCPVFGYLSTMPKTIAGYYTCPSGGALNGSTCVVSSSYTAVAQYSCNSGGTLSGTTCNTTSVIGATCPAGTWLDGAIDRCVNANPLCPGGSFDSTADVCYTAKDKCPTGFDASYTTNTCSAPVSCPAGSYYDLMGDKCYQYTCPSGYSISSVQAANPVCIAPVTCSKGFFGPQVDPDYYPSLCMYTPPQTCPSGYSYNSGIGACIAGYSCVAGTALNTTADKCQVEEVYGCPGGFTASGTTCYQSPTCATGGTYSTTLNKCDAGSNICTGYAFDTAADKCYAAASCNSSGTLNGTSDKCELSTSTTCGAGFIKDTTYNVCQKASSCDAGGTLNTTSDKCVAVANFTCPAGYGYNTSLSLCSRNADCNSSGIINPTRDRCELDNGYSCSTGFSQDTVAQKCYQSPTCATGGTYSTTLNKCDAGVSKVCGVAGFTVDLVNKVCQNQADCGPGTLNTTSDKCEQTATVNCGTWAYDSGTGICFSPTSCGLGLYNATTNECQATITRNCGTYIWDQAATKCTQAVTCPKDLNFSLNSTIAHDPVLDLCVSETDHQCAAGLAWNSVPVNKCEAVPICTGNGIYDPKADSCFVGMNTCPLGTQYQCMEYGAEMRCSPNQCVNSVSDAIIEDVDESMLKDDARDAQGNCLGEIYIFNGKPSRCRPPGLTVGVINDCCKGDEIISEDTGSSISSAVSGIQTAYEIGQVAYYGNALVTGAAQISAISTTTTGAVTSMTVITAGGTTTTLSGAAATGTYATMASGATGASAVSTGMQAYAAALLNPVTIAITAAIMVGMKVLMGNGCDQGDIQTASQVKSEQCHSVGSYCYKKFLFGCVQTARGYCCFNSKMARIIHEQGRPQLKQFQPGGNWGSGKSPNCRGFTPEEFQSLDFSRIDMSEYFDDIQKDMTTKISDSQQTITDNINRKFNAVTAP